VIHGVCLAGPTAAGKTAVALAFAAEVPLEIVSVDSALVYRGMDIGTAKPDAAERAAVPHHLIDLIDPAERYSAARFAADARGCIAEIRARGRLPLLVGGTMLYFKALREGIDAMPAADPACARLDARAAGRGWPALHAELARVDPVTAARLAPADAQRIQRALEVWLASGRPLSAWQQQRGEGATVALATRWRWGALARAARWRCPRDRRWRAGGGGGGGGGASAWPAAQAPDATRRSALHAAAAGAARRCLPPSATRRSSTSRWSCAPGEFVALLGESGVGKSTLLNCIAGLDRADRGSVWVGGSRTWPRWTTTRAPGCGGEHWASCSRPSTCCRT
jgi:hypothetical protein